jgi:hypothetical protein
MEPRARETFQKFWTKDKTENLLQILEKQAENGDIQHDKVAKVIKIYFITRNPRVNHSTLLFFCDFFCIFILIFLELAIHLVNFKRNKIKNVKLH